MVLIDMEPVLLWSDHHAYHELARDWTGGSTWTQYSHEGNDFDGGECIFINQVRPNQTPRPPQPSFTMNSNDLYPVSPKSLGGRRLLLSITFCALIMNALTVAKSGHVPSSNSIST
jgi:hypothetical protein